MLVLGYCKLVSKKGQNMAKIQCGRDYTDSEQQRLNGAFGTCVEDVWIYEPLLEKLTPSCLGKELIITGTWQNGRMVVSDINFK